MLAITDCVDASPKESIFKDLILIPFSTTSVYVVHLFLVASEDSSKTKHYL
jgi:hypothetical protein|uniref:Polygalacturonase inhibiting protein n=1 Tax=Arabidopsis thaliana TaxID=3702 RepID=Q56ZQ5_ARATH|nr:polygalacturonase inhibiting protein [Arabidopsis thaliana]